jgi:hypothetical protein
MKPLRLILFGSSLLFSISISHAACLTPPVGDAAPAIESLLNSGQDAVLCQNATYDIATPIDYPEFGKTDVAIYTEGSPTGASRALLRYIQGPDSNRGVMLQAEHWPGQHGATLRHVRVDGGSQTYGFCDPNVGSQCGAMIAFGGPSRYQRVEYVEAKYPRGWSALQVKDVWTEESGYPDRCESAVVQFNTVGPAGKWPASSTNPTKLADGLSIGCSYSVVQYNTITDVTDVGIAIFGSPYTHFYQNNIYFNTVRSIGGISMSDLWSPGDPDNSGTVVESNTITAGCNAYAPFGISMGVRMANCNETISFSHGARVINNTVNGRVGYGYAMAGVFWWETVGNTYNSYGCGPTGTATRVCSSSGASARAFVMEPGFTTGRPDCGTACFQPQFVNDSRLAGSQIRVP